MSRLLTDGQLPATRSWPPGPPATPAPTSTRASIFREQLDGGYMGVAKLRDESFEQVKELPVDVELVLLRRPIVGG